MSREKQGEEMLTLEKGKVDSPKNRKRKGPSALRQFNMMSVLNTSESYIRRPYIAILV